MLQLQMVIVLFAFVLMFLVPVHSNCCSKRKNKPKSSNKKESGTSKQDSKPQSLSTGPDTAHNPIALTEEQKPQSPGNQTQSNASTAVSNLPPESNVAGNEPSRTTKASGKVSATAVSAGDVSQQEPPRSNRLPQSTNNINIKKKLEQDDDELAAPADNGIDIKDMSERRFSDDPTLKEVDSLDGENSQKEKKKPN